MAEPTRADATLQVGGASIPKLGLGTWQNTGEQCAETVKTALNLGYRHIDTAQAYDNEAMVGKGLAAADVERTDVFLTTKVWRGHLDHDSVIDTVRQSRNRLGVESIDLLLIHGPHPRVSVEEPLSAMAQLRREGTINHIGVSNFTSGQLETALAVSDVPLVTNQVMYHPYKDQSQLLEVCTNHDLALTAYSPLARGDVFESARLTRIGDRHGKTAAQVALRWLLQQDRVVAVPKATGPGHLAENLDVFGFSLTAEEMDAIDGITPGVTRRLRNVLLPLQMRWLPV